MNDPLDFFQIPPERELPPARFSTRRAELVRAVEGDLARDAKRRLRRLGVRAWLFLLALVAVLATADSATAHPSQARGEMLTAAAATAVMAPAVASFLTSQH